MRNEDRSSAAKPKILFIGGSLNQTTQMHQISRAYPSGAVEHFFTPYYVEGWLEACRRHGLLDRTVAGRPLVEKCLDYLERHHLPLDFGGRHHQYDLVFCSQDICIPRNIERSTMVLVQEGMTDPEGLGLSLVRHFRWLPRWIASTAATGLSDCYARFCVASEGYRELFTRRGVRRDKMVITGIPNFDDCERYRRNNFPYRDYVLVCTSDTRETFKWDNRRAFLHWASEIAGGRQMIFKLHPNERWDRSIREIREMISDALIFTEGCGEEMIANCKVLVVQYSSLAYVGLALGKDVRSFFDMTSLKKLLPVQNRSAAVRIARVGCELLGLAPPALEAEPKFSRTTRVA